MARWQPDARLRLVAAALDLFAERGYEDTTVVEIAERAGLTKSTFFRHFPDKREVLFGAGAMAELLSAGIAAAPETATPLEAVAHAMDQVGQETFTPQHRELGARRRAVIDANPELREREALKGLSLIATVVTALEERGVPELTARVAAELGALAMKIAHERWVAAPEGASFGEIARQALAELREITTRC